MSSQLGGVPPRRVDPVPIMWKHLYAKTVPNLRFPYESTPPSLLTKPQAQAQCLRRHARNKKPTIVVCIITSANRHNAVIAQLQSSLKKTHVLVITDSPFHYSAPNVKVVLMPDDTCWGSTHYSAALSLTFNTFASLKFDWILFMEDDTFVHMDNLRRGLRSWDPDVALWITAHGCEAKYVQSGSPPPCLHSSVHDHYCSQRGRGRLSAPAPFCSGDIQYRNSPTSFLQKNSGHNFMKWVNGSALVQSNCGGLACVFSRGLFQSVNHTFLNSELCANCMKGMADFQLSYCLIASSGITPIGVPGLSWGNSSKNMMEALVYALPSCVATCTKDDCRRSCVTSLGVTEIWTVHLRHEKKTWRELALDQLIVLLNNASGYAEQLIRNIGKHFK